MIVFKALRFLASAGIVAGFTLAAASAARIGLADYWFQQQTVTGTEQALRWAPDQALYWTRLALLLSDDDPERAMKALKRAVALNPLDARAGIELGLRFEAQDNFPDAEQAFLRAAEADKEYLPAWSLTNYYFRRDDSEKFWFWSGAATGIVYGDPSPLFRLCWNFTSDGGLIEERLAIGSPRVQASYLKYLLDQNRLGYAAAMAKRLIRSERDEDTPLLLETCERLLADRRSGEAMEIWNQLAESRKIPYGRLTPEDGLSLTNGSFSIAPVSSGFDWHLPMIPGVRAAREQNPSGIRFSFSGDQPERCEIASQFLPVVEHGRYSLSYLSRTSGLAAGSGLEWRVLSGDEASNLAGSESLFSEQEAQGELSFVVPARCRFVRLVLNYQRAPGFTRIEGFVTLRSLALKRLAPRS